MIWRCRELAFDFGGRARVMGVLNLTPDSFSDGGRFMDPAAALAHARGMIREGAEMIDLGAESTRPGSAAVPADEQWRRLEPVLGPLVAELRGPLAGEARGADPGAAGEPTRTAVALSIDTSSAEVAGRALEAGAHVINDVTALGEPRMAEVIARAGAGVVLMHMRGTPATMQADPHYEDVAREVAAWLAGRLERAALAGIAAERIALDPGIGFGKTTRHNLELIARLRELAALGRPIVVGASRKRFLGEITGKPVDERLAAGLAAVAIAAFEGASVIRTHDVAATARAIAVARALREAARSE